MLRALTAISSAALIAVGCVSVGPTATTQPSGLVPSLGITTPAATVAVTATPSTVPTPSAPPTATPTIELTPDVTASPTLEPSVAPSETPEPIETPATTTGDVLFFDEMDDPTSGWTTGSASFAEIAYDVTSLEIAMLQSPAYAYSARSLDEEYGVVLSAAEFNPSTEGGAALLCLAPDDGAGDVAVGALFTTDGDVLFISIAGGEVDALETNSVGIEMPVGESTLFGIACAGTSTGALRLTAFGQDTGPLATYQSDEGPETFSRVGLYGETSTEGFVLDVETAASYGISGSAVAMSPDGEELLTHVPSDWQNQCFQPPAVNAETAAIVCFLQQEGVGVELVAYEQHATNEEMDAEYQERVETFGVESTGSCQEGPNETTWSIGQETFGRIQCSPQLVGTRTDWTDDRLGILSSLVDFDEDAYETLYNTWLDAGPNL